MSLGARERAVRRQRASSNLDSTDICAVLTLCQADNPLSFNKAGVTGRKNARCDHIKRKRAHNSRKHRIKRCFVFSPVDFVFLFGCS